MNAAALFYHQHRGDWIFVSGWPCPLTFTTGILYSFVIISSLPSVTCLSFHLLHWLCCWFGRLTCTESSCFCVESCCHLWNMFTKGQLKKSQKKILDVRNALHQGFPVILTCNTSKWKETSTCYTTARLIYTTQYESSSSLFCILKVSDESNIKEILIDVQNHNSDCCFDRSRIITSQSQLVRKGAITSLSPYQNLLATATSNQLVMAGRLPVNLPSAIRCAQKSNRRSIHSTNPCIDPLWLEHLLFSTLAIDLSIYVKDKNSSTEKVNCGITSLRFFSVFRKN